jgi:hypothetical protein
MSALRLFSAFALTSAVAASAAAQAKPQYISHFTPAIVVKALTELGVKDASASKQAVGGGQSVDVVRFSNGGLKHVALLAGCSAKGCLGLQFLTMWGDEAAKSISRTALNSYNANYPFAKAFTGPNNTLAITRYTISDGGVSVDNLKSNIANFANASQNFIQIMAKSVGGTEASLKGDAALVHAGATVLPPEVEGIIIELGASQGLNALSIQASPIPDAPASKPAQ